MRPNQQVTTLRKSGRLNDALSFGLNALQNNPNDTYLKGALAWVYYEFIKNDALNLKNLVEKSPNNSAKQPLVQQIHRNSQAYYRLQLSLPDLAGSNIMRVLTTVGSHLPFFAAWCTWFGVDGFSEEDFSFFATEKANLSSLFTRVARELVAWRVQPENNTNEADNTIRLFLDTAIRNAREDQANKVWLYRDLSKFHLRRGEYQKAKESLRPVLKAKSRDFWIWGDLAQITEHTSVDMAISCLCQALLCRAPVNFTGQIRLHLARLLIDKQVLAPAITECLIVADAYQKESWKFPEQLEMMMQSVWFDPGLRQTADKQDSFYKKHAQAAQMLVYDNLQQQDATFLAGFTLGKNQQLKALFAIKQNHKSVQVLADAPWNEDSQPISGSGFTLILGNDNRGMRVLGIKPREGSVSWDCLNCTPALVEHLNPNKKAGSLFIDRNNSIVINNCDYEATKELGLGSFVQVRIAYNTAKDRFEAFGVSPLESASAMKDVDTQRGVLNVHERGFAFVGDVFVPPPLVQKELDEKEVEVLCVYKKKRNGSSYGWTAVKVTPIYNESDE